MIEKVVKIRDLNEQKCESIQDDLKYWRSKSPQERIEAVEYLRRQYNGDTTRLQKSVRVIQLSIGRKKDLSDLEALGEE